MKKHTKTLVLVLLALSLLGNLTLASIMRESKREKSLVGTYCTGDGRQPGGEYLVFTQDGAYTRYRQLEAPEEGAYRQDGHVFYLDAVAGHYDGKDTVVLFTGQDAAAYSRLSDIPMYINVPNHMDNQD